MTVTTPSVPPDVGELSSSLVAQETTPTGATPNAYEDQHPLALQSRSQRRVHGSHVKLRSKLINALWSGGAGGHAKRARRLGLCGCSPSLRTATAGSIGVDVARCRDRICPLCSIVRGRDVKSRVLACVERWHTCRFGTLTLKATSDSLTTRFEDMDRWFAALRKEPVWKDNVTHAIAIPEVTIGKQGQWHVHLHFLCAGDFIPWAQLKAAWKKVTGDSFIVDIQAVHDKQDAAKYVAGYIAKASDMIAWSDSQIEEFATATHGRRMLRTYGAAVLPKLDEDDEADTEGPTTFLCNVNAIHRAEESGLELVRYAVDILARMGPTIATVLDRDMPGPGFARVESREYAFASGVCEAVERAFPKLPTDEELERLRRHCFSIPEPLPPPKYVQLAIDSLRHIWHR